MRVGSVDEGCRLTEGLRPPTTQQFVLTELRRAITAGRLRPGAAIRQDVLADELGVSRVPLREALKTLQGEGLVNYQARRGYFVENLSFDDLREAYRIRHILEGEAVREAVARLTSADLTRLTAIEQEVEHASAAGDVLEMAAANRRFHMELFNVSRMPRLVRLIQGLWDATDAYRSMYYGEVGNRVRVVKEHNQVLTALRRRDAERVVRLLEAHRAHAVTVLEASLQD